MQAWYSYIIPKMEGIGMPEVGKEWLQHVEVLSLVYGLEELCFFFSPEVLLRHFVDCGGFGEISLPVPSEGELPNEKPPLAVAEFYRGVTKIFC